MGDVYNAVFEGGGAKGIAYAGALQACEEAGIRFASVAGSSAGAITATLVACGYTAHEVAEAMPGALAAIAGLSRSIVRFGRPSLLNSRKLHDWLAKAVAAKIPGSGPERTFGQVRAATGITLYVVTLDLATRQPVVFSPDLTPDAPVASAVVASSAIPVAFPPVRMTDGEGIRRLVDGGTWANYPSFVFHDQDFIDHHGLEAPTVPTLGFILDEARRAAMVVPSSLRPVDKGRPQMSDHGSSARELDIFGAIVSSRWFRWTASIIPLLFIFFAAEWLYYEIWHGAPTIRHLLPASLQDLALVATVLVLSVTSVLALVIAVFTMRFGHGIFDTGLLGVRAAMGVGPGVPYWVGTPGLGTGADRHSTVRIAVPRGLSTLKFSPPAALANDAISEGYDATWSLLVALGRPDGRATPMAMTVHHPLIAAVTRLFTGPPGSLRRRLWRLPTWPIRAGRQSAFVQALVLVFVTSVAITTAYQVLHQVADDELGAELGRHVAVAILCAGVLVYVLGAIRWKQARHGARTRWLSRLPQPALAAIAVASGFMLFGMVLVFAQSDVWNRTSIVSSLGLEWTETKVADSTDESLVVVAPPAVADALSTTDVAYYDEEGRIIEHGTCPESDALCLTFAKADAGYEVGEDIWMSFSTQRAKATAGGDYWSRSAGENLYGYVFIGFGSLTVLNRSLRTLRVKRATPTR